MTAETASTFPQNLTTVGSDDPPLLRKLAGMIGRLAHRFSRESLGSSNGKSGKFTAAVFGWCPVLNRFAIYQLTPRWSSSKRHYHVDFAARCARMHFPTLSAFSSIWRIESLIQDTRMLDELRELAEANEIRFGNRMRTYEIVDYFPVGFVTCLDWHAHA